MVSQMQIRKNQVKGSYCELQKLMYVIGDKSFHNKGPSPVVYCNKNVTSLQ